MTIAEAPAWTRESPRDRSLTINDLAAALAKAQAAILPAAKDSANPFYKSNYADLASVTNACRAALTANDLAIVQRTIGDAPNVGITTTLMHGSGQWIEGTIKVSLPHDCTPQQVGSALTYLRRYSLAAMVGVAPEDDDGNAASTRTDRPANDNAPPRVSARRAESSPSHDGSNPPSSPAKFTLSALRKYHKLREGMGVSEDEARERVSKVIGRKIGSINDIDAAEMGRVLDKMEAQANGSV